MSEMANCICCLYFCLPEIKVALLLANFIGMHLLASEYLVEIQ